MDVRIIRLFRPPAAPMPLYIHTVGYNKQAPMARPDGFSTHQLLFVRGGQGEVRIKGREPFTFGPMQYMLLPAELPHEYYSVSEEPWEVGYISFGGSKVEALLQHYSLEGCRRYELINADSVWTVLDGLWDMADTNPEGVEWEAVRMFHGLLLDLWRLQSEQRQDLQEPAADINEEAARALVQKAADYLNEHYSENVSLSNVASSLGITHQYLNRLFHKYYGDSMLQYVQKIRLDTAIGYLKAKESMTVKEVASYVGMETNYFIRMFRKATGMTPDQYRKRHWKEAGSK